MWIHNKCSLITESEFDSVENTNCNWICPKCDFFNFSDSFFADQLNLDNQNRFDPLANGSGTKASQTESDKNKFISGLKFVSININQRTNSPVNAHLISWPSKAQNIQNLENIWLRNDLALQYSHTFIISISCLYLPTFRSQAAILSEKSTVFTFSHRKHK